MNRTEYKVDVMACEDAEMDSTDPIMNKLHQSIQRERQLTKRCKEKEVMDGLKREVCNMINK